MITPGSHAGEPLHVRSTLERADRRWDTDEDEARASLSAAIALVLRLLGHASWPHSHLHNTDKSCPNLGERQSRSDREGAGAKRGASDGPLSNTHACNHGTCRRSVQRTPRRRCTPPSTRSTPRDTRSSNCLPAARHSGSHCSRPASVDPDSPARRPAAALAPRAAAWARPPRRVAAAAEAAAIPGAAAAYPRRLAGEGAAAVAATAATAPAQCLAARPAAVVDPFPGADPARPPVRPTSHHAPP